MRLSPVLALVLSSLLLPGCGGSAHTAGQTRGPTGEPRQGAGDEAGERERAANRIPRSDRVAFVAIGAASGAVRARAALVTEGQRERPGARADTAQARQVLVAARPRDAGLVTLRRETLAAVDAAGRLPQLHTARSLLARTDAINSGLRRYAQR